MMHTQAITRDDDTLLRQGSTEPTSSFLHWWKF